MAIVKRGDIVFYNDSANGGTFRVALVVDIYAGSDAPDCGLCVFLTGFHMPSFSISRAAHGEKVGQYLTADEHEALLAQAASSAEEKADAAGDSIAAAISALEPIGDVVAQPNKSKSK